MSTPDERSARTPEALYELKLGVLLRFVNYIHGKDCFICPMKDNTETVNVTDLVEGFLKGETK